MDGYTTSPPQDGTTPPLFNRPNASSTTLYFDAMPSMSSLFKLPHVQNRSNSPERGIKSSISAPMPTDPVQNSQSVHINGNTNMGDGEDDKTTLGAGGSTHADHILASDAPLQYSPPVMVKTETTVGTSRRGNDSPANDLSSRPSSSHNRSLSRSEDHHGGATDERSLRSVPVVYTNTIPQGEEAVSNRSQTDVSRKVSVKRTPSKLVKRRSTKGKQAEYLVGGHNLKGEGSASRRSVSRTSQRSFRSSRGPVFDMVTIPQNATLDDAGGAFGAGAVMAAPEHEVEDQLQTEFDERSARAELALTKKQSTKIHKEECASTRSVFVRLSISYAFFSQWRCRSGSPRSSSRKGRLKGIPLGLRLMN